MLVKCVAKFGKDLPVDCLQPRAGFGVDHEFHLIIDKYYIVYGMTVAGGYIWYYICDESYSYYPVWNPSPLFEVAQGQLSKFWVYAHERYKDGLRVIISYPEWANNFYDYYNRLTDGDEKEVEIFKKYKSLMDLEFPNPSILESATVFEEPWLYCPICIDGWECTSRAGMVICPKCENMLHNPRYEQ
jgi:hypothetical protein